MSVFKNLMFEYQKKHNIKQDCLTNCAVFMTLMKAFSPNDKIIAVPTICVFMDKDFDRLHFCVHAVVSADNGKNVMDISYEIDIKSPIENKTYFNSWKEFNKFLKEEDLKTKIARDLICPYTNKSLDLKFLLNHFLKITDSCNKLNECPSNGIGWSETEDLFINQFNYVGSKIHKADEKEYNKKFWESVKK